MKFEEAMENLRQDKILTRKAWISKDLLTLDLKNKKFIKNKTNDYTPTTEDHLAEDWELVCPDEIVEFHISANELKELGVDETKIDELRKRKNPYISDELVKKLRDEILLPDYSSVDRLSIKPMMINNLSIK